MRCSRYAAALVGAALAMGSAPGLGAARGDGESLTVSLLTFSPGEVYWQRFGHNALLVSDRLTGEALAYNYGLFDFEQKNFFLNFARGRMSYRLGVFELEPMLAAYRRDGRAVWEQRLNLAPARRAELDRFLRWNAQPGNAAYYYDYFRDNCSTRVRDALDRALEGGLHHALTGRSAGITYRSESVRLLWPDRLLALGMDLGLGPASDRPLDKWDAAFSPRILMESLRDFTIPDAAGRAQPLVAHESEMLAGTLPQPPAELPERFVSYAAAGAIAATALLALGLVGGTPGARVSSGLAAGFLVVCGVAGLVSVALWALTAHWAGWRNPMLLLLNPLCLLLLPVWLRARRRPWRVGTSDLRLAALVLAMAAASAIFAAADIGRASTHWIGLLLPVHAAFGFLLLGQRRA